VWNTIDAEEEMTVRRRGHVLAAMTAREIVMSQMVMRIVLFPT
jgi:hypothetical protein